LNKFYILDCDDQQWDNIIKLFSGTFKNIFFSRQFAKLAQQTIYKNHKVICLVAEQNKDIIICPVVLRKFHYKNDIFYDLTSIYSHTCPIINNSNNKELKLYFEKELNSFCKTKNIINYFIRYHPLMGDYNVITSNTKIFNTGEYVYLDLNKLSLPVINNFATRHIKSIRKAKNNKIQIIIDNKNELIHNFIDLYYSEMTKKNADKFYFFEKNFFLNLSNSNFQYQFFYAEHDQKIISCELVLYDEKYSYSYLGATDENYKDLCPNHLLKEAIVLFFKNQDLNFYLLGGGNTGITKYKEGFSNVNNLSNLIGIINYDNDYNNYLNKSFSIKYNLDEFKKIQFYEQFL
jgi:hypothetical protein